MKKLEFRKIFSWMPWITLVLLGGVFGLFVLDIFVTNPRYIGILIIFMALAISTFAIDSMMKENPEQEKKYFLHWIILCSLFAFFGFSVWLWYV